MYDVFFYKYPRIKSGIAIFMRFDTEINSPFLAGTRISQDWRVAAARTIPIIPCIYVSDFHIYDLHHGIIYVITQSFICIYISAYIIYHCACVSHCMVVSASISSITINLIFLKKRGEPAACHNTRIYVLRKFGCTSKGVKRGREREAFRQSSMLLFFYFVQTSHVCYSYGCVHTLIYEWKTSHLYW